MIVFGTNESRVIIYFLEESFKDISFVESNYEKNVFSAKEITISDSGRIFILGQGKTKLQELQLRQTKVNNNWIRELCLKVFAKDTSRLKLSKTRFSGHFGIRYFWSGVSHALDMVQFKRREIITSTYSFDETKNVLYHMVDYKIKSNFGKETAKQRVFVYDFGEQDGDFVYRDKISIIELRKSIASYSRSILTQNVTVEKDYMVGLSAIKKYESTNVDLVIFMASGIRVFIDFPRGVAGKPFKTNGFRFYDPYRIRSSFGIKFIRFSRINISQKPKGESTISTIKNDIGFFDRYKVVPSLLDNRSIIRQSFSDPAERQTVKRAIRQKFHLNSFFVLANENPLCNNPFALTRNWRPASILANSGFSLISGSPSLIPVESVLIITDNNDEEIVDITPMACDPGFSYYKILPHSVNRRTPWTFSIPTLGFTFSETNTQESIKTIPVREHRVRPHLSQLKFVSLNDFSHQVYFPPKTYIVRSYTKLGLHVMLRPVDVCYTYLKAMSLMQIENQLYHESYMNMPDLLEFVRSIGLLNFCACLIQILSNTEEDFFISIPILQNALESVVFKDTKAHYKANASIIQKVLNDCRNMAKVGNWRTAQKYSKEAHLVLREFAKLRDEPPNLKPERFANLIDSYQSKEFEEPLVVTESPISDSYLIKIIETFAFNFNNYIQIIDRRAGHATFDGISSIMDNRSFTSADPNISKGLFGSDSDKDSQISIFQESCFVYMSRILG